MTNKSGANGHYGYLFEEPVDEISGDILIDLENLQPEMKQTILLLVKNAANRDAAQKALSDIMKQIEFDVTAADLQHIFLNQVTLKDQHGKKGTEPPRNDPLKEWQFRSPPILAFSGL
ncbi:hypothetical protein [Citrobacter portucalensis]